jgi:hypothetical protein
MRRAASPTRWLASSRPVPRLRPRPLPGVPLALAVVGAEPVSGAVMVCVGGPPGAPLGQYLVSFDPEAFGGRGWADWSSDRGQALHFEDYAAALDYWRQTSHTRPRRPDGQPNRPLTTFTVTMEPG